MTTDVCVPISALPEMIRVTKEDIAEHGLVGPMVGHVGDGNFHTMLLFDPDNLDEKRKCKEVANRMARRALTLGGTWFKSFIVRKNFTFENCKKKKYSSFLRLFTIFLMYSRNMYWRARGWSG